MLSESFRSIPVHTTRMRELLTDPVLLAAIVCLRDEVTEMLRGDHAAGYHFIRGFNNCIDTLLELQEPIPTPDPEPKETWEPHEPETISGQHNLWQTK